MKYKTKPIEIEAFRWTGDMDQTEDPEWICEALKSGVVSIENFGGSLCMSLPNEDGALIGDYIIRHADGDITGMDAQEFQETYEPCEQ